MFALILDTFQLHQEIQDKEEWIKSLTQELQSVMQYCLAAQPPTVPYTLKSPFLIA